MNLIDFKAGDVVKVFIKDIEDNKVRATPFQGVVIAVKGQKQSRTFTVRKNAADNVIVERIFPITSTIIEKIQVVKKGNARRAKLYYLRKK